VGKGAFINEEAAQRKLSAGAPGDVCHRTRCQRTGYVLYLQAGFPGSINAHPRVVVALEWRGHGLYRGPLSYSPRC
jgi:hypothetical protein